MVQVVQVVQVVQMVQVVQVVQMVQVVQVIQVFRWSDGQVVRWSGGKSGQGGHPGWFVRVPPYEILVFPANFIFFSETR